MDPDADMNGALKDANRYESMPIEQTFRGIECSSGETLTSAGSLEIFGHVWKYSKLRCRNLSHLVCHQVEHSLNTC